MTATLIAPAAYQAFQTQSGAQYTADYRGFISGVAAGTDITDLIKSGCALLPAQEVQGHLPWVAGRVYGLPKGASQTTLLTVTGTLYAYPIFVPNNVIVKSISFSSTTGETGGAAHLGIFNDLNGYPNQLVAGSDSGALAATSTAVGTKSYSSPYIALTPGWYWLASIFTASSTFPTVEALSAVYTGDLANELGYDTIAHALAGASQAGTGISVAATYGAMTTLTPFPSGGTVSQNAATPSIALGL